jgi:methylthioribose-1-phosphate isomerase
MRIPHPSPLSGHAYSAAELSVERDRVIVMDQRLLPTEETYVLYDTVEGVAASIRDMVVRGAPAIGITAAYGMALAARTKGDFAKEVRAAGEMLARTRPTAVNLFWAIDRMTRLAREIESLAVAERAARMADEALAIHREDVAACKTMGSLGARFMPDEGTVLTHCNAGALATGGYGTALGVIRGAVAAGKKIRVLADETRPYLQGARLTAWELHADGIPVEVITDNMAAHFFQRGEILAVVVGSDRIAANGDVANKIGTYGVACLAHMHERPFVVAAPWSTVDLKTPDGRGIPIEERSAGEVTHVGSRQLVPSGVGVRHPGFDVTPAHLVTAIVTERGVAEPPSSRTIATIAPR